MILQYEENCGNGRFPLDNYQMSQNDAFGKMMHTGNMN